MKQRGYLRTRAPLLCAALALAAASCACAGTTQTANDSSPAASPQPTSQSAAKREALPPSSDPQPDTTAQPSPTPATFAPPQVSEVRAALERTYKGAVALDERHLRAVVGDFNGDGSEDLAVEVRPAPGRVPALNDELANWIVTDPRKVVPPDPRNFDPHQGVQKLAPPSGPTRVEAGDTLLVVIHGFKESGWRNPEALQTYVLKNAAGSGMSVQPRAEAQAAAQKHTPRLLGDVIRQRLDNEQGFLYWTGASYGWFH
jgi:hypothetical protein